MFEFIFLDVTAAIEVKGPDGFPFLIALLVFLVLPILFFSLRAIRNRGKTNQKSGSFFVRKKIIVVLEKDRKYYPDQIRVSVKNTGTKDVDLDQPLLIFRNFWSKRKFRLKGTNRYNFYPLLLEPGKSHDLTIDLNHFYRHDRRLKRFPRITLQVSDVSGKRFSPTSIMLRKTLFR
jgi:hypothetical protein